MPTVSVIIPSYNLGKYLPETLDSVLAQSFSDWECIVVDDCSPDGSATIAEKYAAGDPRFKLIRQSVNRGVAEARNTGMEAANGKYILFLDADDIILPGYMTEAVRALEQDPELSLVYGHAELFGTNLHWYLPTFSPSTMLASNCLYISCFFRRKDILDAGGKVCVRFDSSFRAIFEDWDFWLSLMEKVPEFKVLMLESKCFRYRYRRNSRNSEVTDENVAEVRKALWEKHKALYAEYFCDPRQTVEYRRMERNFRKASRWSLAWKLRLLYRKLFK